LIRKDDFDRTNSNDIGGDWEDTNARILDNRLTQQAVGPMRAITTTVHTSELMVVDAAVSFTSTSITVDVGGVIVNYLDANNFLFVQIEVISSAFAGTVSTKLKFYSRTAGVDTQLGSTRTIDGSNGIINNQLRVCYDGVYLSAMGFREAAAKIVDGFRSGVYSNASSAVYFDNFRWYVHKTGCPKCNVLCVSCDGQATETYVLDFGAGGLTDGTCTYCNELAGEFVVVSSPFGPPIACSSLGDRSTPCLWLYALKRDPCIPSVECGHICITLTIHFLSGSSFAWRVGVALCTAPGSAPWEAIYTSAAVTDCTATATLNLDVQNLFGCGGSYPASIELRAVL